MSDFTIIFWTQLFCFSLHYLRNTYPIYLEYHVCIIIYVLILEELCQDVLYYIVIGCLGCAPFEWVVYLLPLLVSSVRELTNLFYHRTLMQARIYCEFNHYIYFIRIHVVDARVVLKLFWRFSWKFKCPPINFSL